MTWRAIIPGLLVGLPLLTGPVRPLPGQVVPWQGLFQSVAGPRWIDRAAQVQAESGFDPQARSAVGAMGPAQFMPASWKQWGKGDAHNPANAIPAQHRYMNWLEPRSGGLEPGLASYNWGLGNVQRVQRHVRALALPGSQEWIRLLPKETQGYLQHNAQFREAIRRKSR